MITVDSQPAPDTFLKSYDIGLVADFYIYYIIEYQYWAI